MLRTVFCGTADFAVPSLEGCATGTEVLAVITQPDRLGNRGRPAARPVADAARQHRLRVMQPERIRDPQVVQEILTLGADVLVVAAYGQIIPVALLDGHRLGGVNVHASLLPRWRGAAPVHHAILHGDTQTGVCIMRMERGLDTGPVYASSTVTLQDNDTTPLLTDRLARAGAALLLQVLEALERGDATATAQDERTATLAPRLTRQAGQVDWGTHDAVTVDRTVRALQPWPGVHAALAGQTVRILRGAPLYGDEDAAPGTTRVAADSVAVATLRNWYRIDTVQPAGGRAMPAAAYLRGRRGQGP